jgi:hypothetical protein
MSTTKIFIVGYEPKDGCNGSGGFRWNFTQEGIDKMRSELYPATMNEYTIYSGSIDLDTESMDNDEITDAVEAFLETNNWENSFI